MNTQLLKKLALPEKNEITEIHNEMKEENENTLADFYSKEMEQDLKKKINESKSKQDLYFGENIIKDYLISDNNNKMNEVPQGPINFKRQNQDELLNKLNYIINMFEEQREIKTNQKNEEVVLYCFLGIFVIYVLDSFVYIGKYKR